MQNEISVDRPRKGRPRSCVSANREIEIDGDNGVPADTMVRGARYQNTRLIYVGFVGEGIRSNTFSDGYFGILQISVTILSWGVFWRPAGDGKAVQNGGWASQKTIEFITNNRFGKNS